MTRELLVQVLEEGGEVASEFDFGKLGISIPVAHALMRSFVANFGHNSVETQRQAWRSIRRYTTYLIHTGQCAEFMFRKDSAIGFQNWLSEEPITGSTKQTHLNIVLATLAWCLRNIPDVAPRNLSLNVPRFQRQAPQKLTAPSAQIVKAVLEKCYVVIDKAEENIGLGRRLLKKKWESENEVVLGQLLLELLDLGQECLPSQRLVSHSGNSLARRVIDQGGYRVLAEYLWPSPTTVFAFYLAILIQTGGNPMSIRQLKRDCVIAHPLRQDLELIVWEKLRAKAEQIVEFPKGKYWSAPSLTRRLLDLNQPLVALAQKQHFKDKLFLSYANGNATVGCFQLLHTQLTTFIEQHNFEPFTFKMFRKTNAIERRLISQDSRDSQRRLNHKSARTTMSYTDSLPVRELFDKQIAKYQGLLLMQANKEKSKIKNSIASSVSDPASTVFGFDCANPFAGIATGSRPGQACQQFSSCATCPGAIVVLDDLSIVQRLLGTVDALKQQQQKAIIEGWQKRFDDLYLPTLEILLHDILPAIAPAIIVKAQSTHSKSIIPRLE